MGMFDDLVPQGAATPARGGMFDDLRPTAQPRTPLERQNAVADSMIPRPSDQPAPAPQMRMGDALKPVFGGHNPIAEVSDLIWPNINPEDQAFRDSRGVGERVIDTSNMLASIPVRLATQGQYGLGDALSYFGFPDSGAAVNQREQNFARANAPMLKTIGAIGETSAAFPPGMLTAATYPSASARGVPLPTPQTGRMADQAVSAARDLEAFNNQGVRAFGPAFSQGPMAATAKQLSEVPIIGGPVRNALEDSITGLRDRVTAVADEIAPAATYEQAGSRLQSGLDRFRASGVSELEPGIVEGLGVPAARAIPRGQGLSRGALEDATAAAPIRQQLGNAAETSRGVAVPAARPLSQTLTTRTSAADMTDGALAQFVRAPSHETSFAARQEALYERAFRLVPEMNRMDGTRNPNMLAANNTRQALRAIDENIANDISGASGGITGDLAERIRDARAGNFSLPQLRAMRTEIGRALSGGNPLQQTLNRTHLNTIYSALSRDIENGLETLANRALVRSQNGGNMPNAVARQEAINAVGALRAFRTADRYTRLGMRNIERFIKEVGAKSPEEAARSLIKSSYDGDRGNARKFRAAMSALRPEERNTFSSLVLRELGTPSAGARGLAEEIDFSVATFVTNWRKMSPQARHIMFQGEHAQAIDDLARIGDRMANVEALANTSRSATNSIGLGSVLTGIGSYGAGGLEGLMGMAAGGASLSVLMSRPAYARWAVRYAQIRANALRSPDGARNAIARHVRTLENMARNDPQLAAVAAGIATENNVAPDQPQGRRQFAPPMYLGGPKPDDSLPGVPYGVDGTPGPSFAEIDAMQAKYDKDRAKNALLRYGDTTLIPGLSEIAETALDAVSNAGEAAMAFGPMGHLLDAPWQGVGAVVKSLRARPAEIAIPARTLEEEGARVADVVRRRKEAEAAKKSLERANFSRTQAENAARSGSTGTVPISANRRQVLEFIEANRAGRPIDGMPGLRSVEEQVNALNRIAPPPIQNGPWGPDMPATVRNALGGQARTRAATIVPEANMPGATELYKAAQEARAEVQSLRNQLSDLPDVYDRSAQISTSQRKIITDLKQRLFEVENELYEMKKLEQRLELPPPEASQMQPPRIYRRGGE